MSRDPILTFRLPLPQRDTSPNARVSPWVKAKAVASMRQYAWASTLSALEGCDFPRGAPQYTLSLTYCLPDKRRRDLDNLFSASKAQRDGIADALLVDDVVFEYDKIVRHYGEPPGLLVAIEAGPADGHQGQQELASSLTA